VGNWLHRTRPTDADPFFEGAVFIESPESFPEVVSKLPRRVAAS
jgi:hypothetical protein